MEDDGYELGVTLTIITFLNFNESCVYEYFCENV